MASQEEIRRQITDQIVEALQNDQIPPWRRPWATDPNSGFPTNVVSRRRYRGVNVLLLQMAAMRHGFQSKSWGTFNQWTDLGGRIQRRPSDVRPGGWGCKIVFFKPITKLVTDEETGEEQEESFPLLRTYTVFNIDQVDGEHLDHLRVKDEEPTGFEFIDFGPAEQAIAAIGADIRISGDRCFYKRSDDYIQVPSKHRFDPQHQFYSSVFHELMHWSESRCGWKGSYAEGELRAEIGSAFILTELGVPQSEDLSNHHSYLQRWLMDLRNDSRFIFRAASAASKAVDYILSFTRQPEPEAVVV